MDTKNIVVNGKGLEFVPINSPTSFIISNDDSSLGEIKCLIKGLNDRLLIPTIKRLDKNRCEVVYTPDRVGEYSIEVYHNNIPINKSPFTSRSFDISKIKVYDLPKSTGLGSPTFFFVDATNSGSGNLEISVSRDGKNIPNYVESVGGARFRIKFIPDHVSMYHIEIKFNGLHILGSPFICHAVSSDDFLFENYEYAPINKRTLFKIKPISDSIFNMNMFVEIITPSNDEIKGNIDKISTDSYSMQFIPREIGEHEIRFYNNENKSDLLKKYICHVYDSSKILISDLPVGMMSKLYRFQINIAKVGNGYLSVKIKQNGKEISHNQAKLSDDNYEISFIPETSYDCNVYICFNDENNVRTFTIPIRSDVDKIHVSSVPSGNVDEPTLFTISNVTNPDSLSVQITESHSNRVLSYKMIPIANSKNAYEISFIPKTARQHTIIISDNEHILFDHHIDVHNLNKIHVSSIKDGYVGVQTVFSVDTRGAGEGNLQVTIKDDKQTLPAELKALQGRKFDIAFIPEFSGVHSIDIEFNGIPVRGSPFLINIHDETRNSSNDNTDYQFIIGGQLEGTKVGEVAWFICLTSLTDIYEDLDIFVTDPDNVIIKHTRIQDSGGRWRVEFEPKKSGIHHIKIDIDEVVHVLASMNILSVDYERKVYGERIVHPNILNAIAIESNVENLDIKLLSSDGVEIPIEIDRDLTEWQIFLKLNKIDNYQLSINNNDNEQVFDIICVNEEIDLLRNSGVEDITRIIIDHNKILTDDVNVIVKDPSARTIPVAFYKNVNQDLIIEYISTQTNYHEIFIRTNNNLLDICPIRIMAFSSECEYDPALRVQVKEVLQHTFTGVIDSMNQLDISITDPFDKSITYQRSTNENGELTISLSPTCVGTHWIRISNKESDSFALLPIFSFDDDYIPLSPISTPLPDDKDVRNQNTNSESRTDSYFQNRELTTISETSEFQLSASSSLSPQHVQQTLSPTKDKTLSTISDELSKLSNSNIETLDICDLNDPAIRTISTFTIKNVDRNFKVSIYDANKEIVHHETEELPNARKSISYTVTVVGAVEIHILKDNEDIDGSPLIVHAFDPLSVYLIHFPTKIQLNQMHRFLIDPTQAGKGTLKIKIKDPNNQTVSTTVNQEANKHITVQFLPTSLGIYTVSILFNRILISKAPFQILVENNTEEPITKTMKLSDVEQRGRSLYSKHDLLLLSKNACQPQISPSPSPSSRSLVSKTNEYKDSSFIDDETRFDDKSQSITQNLMFSDFEIQQCQLLKQKFESGQPITIIFDPKQYPFKVFLPTSYPLTNMEIYFLINLPNVGFVHITINNIDIPVQITRKTHDTFLLKFRPTIAGDYSITFKDYIQQLISGSPYLFPVYNPTGIYLDIFNSLQSINDCHFICNLENVGQGKFFLLVYESSKPTKIPYRIQSISLNRVRISLYPRRIGTYRIYIAYRNIPINGTPIDITVYNIEKVTVIPEHIEPVTVRTRVAYKINTSQAGQGQLKAELIQSQRSSKPCRCHIYELKSHEYIVEYIPNEPGRYQLRILFNNQLVQGKLFDTNVYSLLPPSLPALSFCPTVHIEKVLPKDIPKIGDEICLKVVTDKEFLQGQVLYNENFVPCQIEQTNKKYVWLIRFRPFNIGIYRVYLLYNGSPIINSPYLIQINDMNEKYLSGVTNSPYSTLIRLKSPTKAKIRSVVLFHSTEIPSTITIVNDNLIRINFLPKEAGFYLIHVYADNQLVEGSPFSVKIERSGIVQITGKCLNFIRVNDLGIFRVLCQGKKGLVKINILNLSSSNPHETGQRISFKLLETYEQLKLFPSDILLTSLTIVLTARLRLTQTRIRNLKIEDEYGHANLSFDLFEIPQQSPSNEQIINLLKDFIDKQALNLFDPNRNILHVLCGSLIIGPKGEQIPVKLFAQTNGDYVGEFTPRAVGQHRIDVTFDKTPVEYSPFFTEAYDPSRVQIGPLPETIVLGIENTIEVNLENAGNVPFNVTLVSPLNINVPLKIIDLCSKKHIVFTPTEIGLHNLNVKLASDVVSGTPMKIMVNNIRVVSAYGDGIHQALYKKPSIFMIDTNELQGDLDVHIQGRNSVIKPVIDRMSRSLLRVTYTPLELGIIQINVKWNGSNIIYSPFKVLITNPESIKFIDDCQTTIDSQNFMTLVTNEENRIRLDTSLAGSGLLKANIRDEWNSRLPLRIDRQSSLSTLYFTIPHEGTYYLTMSYCDNLLSNMPIQIIAHSNNNEHLNINVYGRGLSKARINEETEFTIDATCVSSSNNVKPLVRLKNDQAHINVEIKQNKIHKHRFHCFYTPTISGAYFLYIKWLNRDISGSPFKVNVIHTLDNKMNYINHDHLAAKVICSGEGLKRGVLGEEMQCFIDTRNTNLGELTAYCQGSHKTAHCRLLDHQNGTFTLFIKPEETGRHILTIKYNDENVPGSPYTVKVNSPPDASKVRVYGPGIEHGVLSTFQSHFICETQGAGAGQLTVKIRGPKGAFHVELQRNHLQDRTILCQYNPTESGDYLISVKWSGIHVYGSPFHTHIFENQDELEQFRHQLISYRLNNQK